MCAAAAHYRTNCRVAEAEAAQRTQLDRSENSLRHFDIQKRMVKAERCQRVHTHTHTHSVSKSISGIGNKNKMTKEDGGEEELLTIIKNMR